MLKFTSINHIARKELGLSWMEFGFADMVYHLSNNPKSPVPNWCNMSRPRMAEEMGVSKRTVLNYIDRLIELDLVEKDPETAYLRTSEKWYEIVISEGGEKIAPLTGGGEKFAREGVKNLHRRGEKISPNNNRDKNKDKNNTKRTTREKISRTDSGSVDVRELKSKIQREEIPPVAPPPLTEPEITPEMYIVTKVDPGPNSERMQVWKMKTGASYETIVAEIQVFASKHLARDYADVAEEKVLGLLQAGNEQRFRRVFESSFLSRIKPNQNNEYRTSSKNGNHTRKKTESEKWDAIFDEIKSGTFGENQPSTEVGYL